MYFYAVVLGFPNPDEFFQTSQHGVNTDQPDDVVRTNVEQVHERYQRGELMGASFVRNLLIYLDTFKHVLNTLNLRSVRLM